MDQQTNAGRCASHSYGHCISQSTSTSWGTAEGYSVTDNFGSSITDPWPEDREQRCSADLRAQLEHELCRFRERLSRYAEILPLTEFLRLRARYEDAFDELLDQGRV